MKGLFALVAVSLALLFAVTASAQTVLVGFTNTVWKYRPNTNDPAYTPLDAWTASTFDDSGWPSGRGLFGFESTAGIYNPEGPFNTYIVPPNGVAAGNPIFPGQVGSPVSAGPTGAGTGGPSVYFRTHFTWTGPATDVFFNFTNAVDDGIIVYLNGAELFAFNMPATPRPMNWDLNNIGANPAPFTAEPIVYPTNLLATGLVTGDNVIAVELHQAGGGSSDDIFGMKLIAQRKAAPCTDGIQPTNRTIIDGRSTTFTVVQGAGCGAPAPTFQWYRSVGVGEELIVGATSDTYTLSNAKDGIDDAPPAEYYCRLINTTAPFVADSRHAVLAINPDVVPPQLLSASIVTTTPPLPDLTHFLLITDEELCNPLSATPCSFEGTTIDSIDPFSWRVLQSDDLSVSLGGLTIEMINSTTYLFTTELNRDPEKRYRIQIDSDPNSVVLDTHGNRTPVGSFAETPSPGTPISVGASGSALYTFDVAPGEREFSTFNFAGAANGTVDTAATFGAKVVVLDGASINVALAAATGTPPAAGGSALWASDGHYLITRATGVEGEVIMAHLRNDSGLARAGLMIDYDLTVEAAVIEEVLGHLVYYSFSGAPNSWTQIPGISGDGAAGLKHETAILDFTATPWAAGANLYILFADDNGSGSPDNANEIDNFKVTFPMGGPPSITLNPQSVGTNEGATVHLDVAATGSVPLSYQWFKGASALTDGGSISGATTTRLTIAGVTSATIGNYFARVSNGILPNADSTVATVSITTLDTTRPTLVSAVGSADGNSIVLTFSKQMAAASVQNTAAYRLVPSGGGAALNISGAVLAANGTTVTLTTANRPFPSAHTLTITGVTDNRQSLNVITSNPTIVTITRDALVMDGYSATPWKYQTNSQDATLTAGTKWFATSFDDSTWPSGLATFGFETGAPLAAAPGGVIMTPLTPNSVAATPDHDVTVYFRKPVTLTAVPAGTVRVVTHYIDDGATFYLDGTRFARFKMTNEPPVLFTNRSSVGGEAVYASEALPPSTTLGVPHLLAIEVHQNGVTTSDVLFAAQIEGIAVPLIITHNADGSITVSWRAVGGLGLFSSATVNGTYTAAAGANNATGTLTVAAGSLAAAAFYELRYIGEP